MLVRLATAEYTLLYDLLFFQSQQCQQQSTRFISTNVPLLSSIDKPEGYKIDLNISNATTLLATAVKVATSKEALKLPSSIFNTRQLT